MIHGRKAWLVVLLLVAPAAGAATTVAKLAAALYQPLVGDRACLSPDGNWIAYTQHEQGRAWVRVTQVDPPHRRKAWPVAVDEPAISQKGEPVTASVTFLAWAGGDRLVVQTDTADVFGIELATGTVRKLVDEDLVNAAIVLDTKILMDHGGQRIAPDRQAIGMDARSARQMGVMTNEARWRQRAGDDAIAPAALAATAAVRDAIIDYAETIESFTDGEGKPDLDRIETEMERLRPIPRIPRVLGLLADRQTLLVSAMGAPPTVPHELYAVNVATGKLTQMEEYELSGTFLCDGQGRPVLAWTNGGGRDTPRAFWRRAPGKKAPQWTPLKGATPGEFAVTSGNYFGERSIVLALEADPTSALVASNVGRDRFAAFRLNLATGERSGPLAEDPRLDLVGLDPRLPHPAAVIDPVSRRVVGIRQDAPPSRTWWSDAGILATQRKVEERFPGRAIELLGWDDARARFLVRVSSATDPGRVHVYQPGDNLCFEVLRRAPGLPRSELAPVQRIASSSSPTAPGSGALVLPSTSRINPPPLLIFLRDDLLQRTSEEFEREVQLFAAMGFIAARVDYRGMAGHGRKHLTAVQAGFDRVPIEDVLNAIEAIGREHAFDRRRVVIVGEGFGGYVALRALQLHPAVFRCAVSLNAPLDLRRWTRGAAADMIAGEIVKPEVTFGRGAAPVLLPSAPIDFFAEMRRTFIARSGVPLGKISVLGDPGTITKPVFLAADPKDPQVDMGDTRDLRNALQKLKRTVEYAEIGPDFGRGAPGARAKVARQLEEFFNLHVYDYKVNVGEAKEAR